MAMWPGLCGSGFWERLQHQLALIGGGCAATGDGSAQPALARRRARSASASARWPAGSADGRAGAARRCRGASAIDAAKALQCVLASFPPGVARLVLAAAPIDVPAGLPELRHAAGVEEVRQAFAGRGDRSAARLGICRRHQQTGRQQGGGQPAQNMVAAMHHSPLSAPMAALLASAEAEMRVAARATPLSRAAGEGRGGGIAKVGSPPPCLPRCAGEGLSPRASLRSMQRRAGDRNASRARTPRAEKPQRILLTARIEVRLQQRELDEIVLCAAAADAFVLPGHRSERIDRTRQNPRARTPRSRATAPAGRSRTGSALRAPSPPSAGRGLRARRHPPSQPAPG